MPSAAAPATNSFTPCIAPATTMMLAQSFLLEPETERFAQAVTNQSTTHSTTVEEQSVCRLRNFTPQFEMYPCQSSLEFRDTPSVASMSSPRSAISPFAQSRQYLVKSAPRWARSTRGLALLTSRAWLARRRLVKSGTSAVVTRAKRPKQWDLPTSACQTKTSMQQLPSGLKRFASGA